jgi:protein-disulfide isomerase
MMRGFKVTVAFGFAILSPISVVPVCAQSSEVQALRKELESLKQGQRAMQKDIRIIRDILSGKQPPLENVIVSTDGAFSQGPKDAKFVIVEFSDFQCPFCARYATQTYSQVIDDYVKPGKLKYVFRNFPLESIHAQALKAAEASQCAGEQDRFWEMHDHLFKNQQSLEDKDYSGHATKLGLDVPKFQQCMESRKYTAKVKKDNDDGTKLGVKGTPTFFFGSVDPKDPTKMRAVALLSGAQPYQEFKDTIDKLLSPPKEDDNDAEGTQ